jgi:hypothetical protein
MLGGVGAQGERISTRAYQLWQETGEPTGRELEFWCRAERAGMTATHNVIFAYGSSLNKARMHGRCPGAEVVSLARLPGHYLCFPRWSNAQKSFVAGFRESASHDLWGIVWRIPADELARLDAAEGYVPGRPDGNSYLRREVTVVLANNTTMQVETYDAVPDVQGTPAFDYVNYIVSGAVEHKLPPDYVARLRQIDTPPERSLRRARTARGRRKQEAEAGAAHDFYHEQLQQWYRAEFIPLKDRWSYGTQYSLGRYGIYLRERRIRRIRGYTIPVLLTAVMLYLCVVTYLAPATAYNAIPLPELSAAIGVSIPVFVSGLARFIGNFFVLTFLAAAWLDIGVFLAAAFSVVGAGDLIAWSFGFGPVLLAAAIVISAGADVPFIAHSSLLLDTLFVVSIAVLGVSAMFLTAVLFLAGVGAWVRRQSEARLPAMHIAASLFDALWGLQQAETYWLGSRIRASAITDVYRAARIAQYRLLQLLPDTEAVTKAWRTRQAGWIAAAFSDKLTWLITPKPNTREALSEKLGPAIVAVLSGAWDDLELKTNDDGHATPRPPLTVIAMDVLRTGLIAALPLAIYLLAEWCDVLTGIDAATNGWLKIGSLVWAVFTVMFRLDPQLKDKVAALKDAATMLKPGGGKKE